MIVVLPSQAIRLDYTLSAAFFPHAMGLEPPYQFVFAI
jgi:hypothetical protein